MHGVKFWTQARASRNDREVLLDSRGYSYCCASKSNDRIAWRCRGSASVTCKSQVTVDIHSKPNLITKAVDHVEKCMPRTDRCKIFQGRTIVREGESACVGPPFDTMR